MMAAAPPSLAVGARLRKSFGALGIFEGTVRELWEGADGAQLAHVIYDDGDEEARAGRTALFLKTNQ